jgi:uncharacterized membrane protein YuzA (DUF378 family)
MTDMRKLDIAALVLIIVGGLNWLLVGLAEFDLVAAISGGLEFGETNWFSRTVYILVGIAAAYEAIRLPAILRGTTAEPARSY